MASIVKRGSSYRVLIRKKGHPVICKTFTARSLAETYAKGVEAEIEKGIFQDHSSAESTSLSELLSCYREQILPSLRGKDAQELRLNLLDSELGSYKLSALIPFVVSQLRDRRLKSAKPATVKRELGVLSSLLTAGEKEFGINLPRGNPVRKIRLPKEPRGRDRRISPEEESRLLKSFENNSIMKAVVVFAIETAMRRREIAQMQQKDINWSTQTLRISETKTDIPRTIPLSKKTIDATLWSLKLS